MEAGRKPPIHITDLDGSVSLKLLIKGVLDCYTSSGMAEVQSLLNGSLAVTTESYFVISARIT